MEIKNICDSCGFVNTVNGNSIKKLDVKTESGDYLRLMYYKCESCKKKVVVQVDNMETRKIFGDYRNLIAKCAVKRQKGETISPKDIRKKDKWEKDLKKIRDGLVSKYRGEKVIKENGEIFLEHLTVNGEYDIL